MNESERCQAMRSREPDGTRCQRKATDGKLCRQHQLSGAVIPDEWLEGGLPVFYIRKRGT
jgi:hypothetical protein